MAYFAFLLIELEHHIPFSSSNANFVFYPWPRLLNSTAYGTSDKYHNCTLGVGGEGEDRIPIYDHGSKLPIANNHILFVFVSKSFRQKSHLLCISVYKNMHNNYIIERAQEMLN